MLNRHWAITLLILFLGAAAFNLSGYAQGEPQVTGQLLPVRVGGKWGYIGKSGKVVIAPQYDYATPFSSDLALVVTNAKIPHLGSPAKFCFLENRTFAPDEAGEYGPTL